MSVGWRRAGVVLAVLIGLCYAGSLTGSFHFDDSHSVQNNPAVRSLGNIPSFWVDSRTSSLIPENRVYRPLVYTFYTFCWALGGGKTWPFHVMKLVMHWLVCLGLFGIWSRLWATPGWFPARGFQVRMPGGFRALEVTPGLTALGLAALFAVHPAGSECVDYISATTSLQCAMFYVGAFWTYLSWRSTRNPRILASSLVCYFLSVASKEEGITLPAMVFFTELFLGSGKVAARLKSALWASLPYVVTGALLAGWIYWMHPPEGNESRGSISSFQYFITQWWAYLWYMRLWFVPRGFNADNASVEFSKSLFEARAILAGLANVLILAAAWRLRKAFPAFLFGLVWFYVTISPASSVVVLAEAINEHRMYLAYVGFVGGTFTLLVAGLQRLAVREKTPAIAGWSFCVAIVALLIGTQERNRVWKNDENLWLDTVEKNPTSGRAYNNLALVYLSQGDFEKAVHYLGECEKHWTEYMYCPLNKGIALQALGRLEEAERSFQKSVRLNPNGVYANFHIANFYQDARKDHEKAIAHYRKALQFTGGRHPEADVRMATSLAALRRYPEAREALLQAISVEPGNVLAWFQLGAFELDAGRPKEALQAYTELLRRDSAHAKGWFNLGIAYLNLGDFPQAKVAFERTTSLDPVNDQGWLNLAYAAEKAEDGKTAVFAARKLNELQPQNGQFKMRLTDLQRKYPQ